MAVSLDFIQSQLKAIQADVREIKFAAEVDRRNAASLYNNLAAEFGAAIGKLEAKVELGFEAVSERIDQLETRIEQLETRIDRLETTVNAGFARIEQLLKKD